MTRCATSQVRRRRSRTLLLASAACLSALLLSGCMHWVKPGATETMREDAIVLCEAEARHQVAPHIVSETIPRPDAPRYQVCHGGGPANCSTYGGYSRPARTETHDASSDERGNVYSLCMRRNGWAWVSK